MKSSENKGTKKIDHRNKLELEITNYKNQIPQINQEISDLENSIQKNQEAIKKLAKELPKLTKIRDEKLTKLNSESYSPDAETLDMYLAKKPVYDIKKEFSNRKFSVTQIKSTLYNLNFEKTKIERILKEGNKLYKLCGFSKNDPVSDEQKYKDNIKFKQVEKLIEIDKDFANSTSIYKIKRQSKYSKVNIANKAFDIIKSLRNPNNISDDKIKGFIHKIERIKKEIRSAHLANSKNPLNKMVRNIFVKSELEILVTTAIKDLATVPKDKKAIISLSPKMQI